MITPRRGIPPQPGTATAATALQRARVTMPTATEIRDTIATCEADAAWAIAHNRPRLARLYRRLARQLLALLD